MNDIPVSQMTLPEFQQTCRQLLQDLNVILPIRDEDEDCIIDFPDTEPLQLFVCNRTSWHIEKAGEGDDFYIFTTINGPNNYEYVEELSRALDRAFNKQIAMLQFNPSEAQLWMAIDKLIDVVHSRM